MSEVETGNQRQTEATKGEEIIKSSNKTWTCLAFYAKLNERTDELTQFAIAEALLLHLALEGPHLLESRFLIVDILSEALQLLLFRGLLQLSLLLLLQVTQSLLLEITGTGEQRSAWRLNKPLFVNLFQEYSTTENMLTYQNTWLNRV